MFVDPNALVVFGLCLVVLTALAVAAWIDPDPRGVSTVPEMIPIPQPLIDSHQPLLAAQGASGDAALAKAKATAALDAARLALAAAQDADRHAGEMLGSRNAALASELAAHQQRERDWFRPVLAPEQLAAAPSVPLAPATVADGAGGAAPPAGPAVDVAAAAPGAAGA